jgi:hypothetical protein
MALRLDLMSVATDIIVLLWRLVGCGRIFWPDVYI